MIVENKEYSREFIELSCPEKQLMSEVNLLINYY